jgi:peptide deformylase
MGKRIMAVKPILKYPHQALRQKAKRVPAIDKSIRKLVADMTDTLHEAKGAGLAAPQIGVSLRVIVLHLQDEEPFAVINPEIVRRSGAREVTEGCLSIPGYQGKLMRSVTVTVKGLDIKGLPKRLKATELLAQALEHEIDHLNGVLYIDRLENPEKLTKIEPEPAPEADTRICDDR